LPWYLLAGALPGLLLLTAESLTRLGGSSLVNLVTGSADEPALVELTDFARLRHAVVVLLVGGIIGLIAAARSASRSDT
jgi:hypothetical protein